MKFMLYTGYLHYESFYDGLPEADSNPLSQSKLFNITDIESEREAKAWILKDNLECLEIYVAKPKEPTVPLSLVNNAATLESFMAKHKEKVDEFHAKNHVKNLADDFQELTVLDFFQKHSSSAVDLLWNVYVDYMQTHEEIDRVYYFSSEDNSYMSKVFTEALR